jgi:hypothetical protein
MIQALVELGGEEQGFIHGRKILESLIFAVHTPLLTTTSPIFLTLLIMCLKRKSMIVW